MKTDQTWSAEIRRTRPTGDFRKPKHHEVYDEAFVKLLRDLKADESLQLNTNSRTGPTTPMPCPKDTSRIDETGRAFAGSQRQIQSCVNFYTESFTTAVADALQLMESSRNSIEWVSPLASNSYDEYRDGEFLDALGLVRFAEELAAFWPTRGPCWDALARCGDGCILVEAKSHVQEIYGQGCGARQSSLSKIEAALNETKTWIGASAGTPWTGRLYQSANRYAHLYFLREKCSVPAYLLNVYFTGDPRTSTSERDWNTAILEVNSALGINSPIPFCATLFFDASKLS